MKRTMEKTAGTRRKKSIKGAAGRDSSTVPNVERSEGSMRDHTDWLLQEWKEQRPDLDVSPIAVLNRLFRLQSYLQPEVARVLEGFGLTFPSFAVIANLYRVGPPYQRTQRALMDALNLTGGTVSVRVDKLVKDGIVERAPDPGDQRGALVRLTEKGKTLFDRVAPLHLANEARLLSALTPDQRRDLAFLLRKLLLNFESMDIQDPNHPSHLLGASLAPPHLARQLRRSAGLPEVDGVLIRSVNVPGPLSDAGLQEGDLIVAAGDTEIRSVENIYELLSARPGAEITFDILRGEKRMSVEVQPLLPPNKSRK